MGFRDGLESCWRRGREALDQGKEIQHKAGLAAVLLLAAMPEANHALVTLAEQHSIPVLPSQEKGT